MTRVILSLIKSYQKYLSNGLLRHLFLIGGCRFQPTCSQYTYQAVEKYGTIKGLFIGLKRIVKCHPWNRGGLDPLK